MMKHIVFTMAALSFLASPGWTGIITYPDFSSTSGLTLKGVAASLNNGMDSNPVLRVATTTTSSGGSAFTNSMFDVSYFSTTFDVRISDSGGALDSDGLLGGEGFVFVIQTVSASELGGLGGSLGYGGISPSVGIEFDIFDSGGETGNHIGINQNGNLSSLATVDATPFNDGHRQSFEISYDGTDLIVTAGGAELSYALDIPSIVGDASAYVGFTAASTGDAFANFDIISWEFNYGNPIPAPGAVLLGSIGIGIVSWLRRRRAI
jgi:hypothetical protein